MSASTSPLAGAPPDWVVRMMPPGYENRLAEIQRLSTELRAMDRYGSLLTERGTGLETAVRDLLTAMKYEVEAVPSAGSCQISVRLDPARRLLLHVADEPDVIQKKDRSVERAFGLLTQMAGAHDRVALVAPGDCALPPGERPAPIAPEALDLLERMGVNFVFSPVLFALWTLSLQDAPRARSYVDRLHAQTGGLVPPPAPGPRG